MKTWLYEQIMCIFVGCSTSVYRCVYMTKIEADLIKANYFILSFCSPHFTSVLPIIYGEEEGRRRAGGVCSLASFKGRFQTIAQNDKGKNGGGKGGW